MNDMVELMKTIVVGTSLATVEQEFMSMEQAECSVVHRFGPGIYIRELSMKAGVMAIGHYQKYDHLNIVLQGRVSVIDKDGSSREVVAPAIFVSPPGRKIGYILEDVVWQNVYATELTDIAKLETHYLDKNPLWAEKVMMLFEIQKIERQPDRDDFKAMTKEYGLDIDTIRYQSEYPYDQVAMPHGSWAFKVDKSPIEGIGVFATSPFVPGQEVGPGRINGNRTPIGRYTNHSKSPNAEFVNTITGDIVLRATQHIHGCHGGENGDEITIDYRSVLKTMNVSKEKP
jgi:hypothetical protein